MRIKLHNIYEASSEIIYLHALYKSILNFAGHLFPKITQLIEISKIKSVKQKEKSQTCVWLFD